MSNSVAIVSTAGILRLQNRTGHITQRNIPTCRVLPVINRLKEVATLIRLHRTGSCVKEHLDYQKTPPGRRGWRFYYTAAATISLRLCADLEQEATYL